MATTAPAWTVRPNTQSGPAYLVVREAIRGLTPGEGRRLVRRITNVPAGVTVDAVRLVIATTPAGTGPVLIEKTAFNPALDVAGAGADGALFLSPAAAPTPEVAFAFTEAELEQLLAVRGFTAEVLLSDSVAQTVAKGTMAAEPLTGTLTGLGTEPAHIELYTTSYSDEGAEIALPPADAPPDPVAAIALEPATLTFGD